MILLTLRLNSISAICHDLYSWDLTPRAQSVSMSEDGVWFEGIRFPNRYQTENLRTACEKFVMKDEDTVIVSYPKSGTLWLIEILCLIHSRGDPKWVQSVPFWKRSPWIEIKYAEQLERDSEDPRFFTSHLPFHLFPKSFFTSKGKVIYIIRNPRDALVSGYFFWSRTNFVKSPDSLEQFFEQFIQGNVPYGSWFEHIRGWMSVRHRENVLLLSYEELQKNPRSTIERICQFLGKKLSPEELDSVLKNSSFQVMKQNKMSNFAVLPEELMNTGFLVTRKGTCGDWKNHFTVAQAEAFDKLYQEKMKGFPGGLFPWE
ncbi:sulfotransferase 2A1 [Marmota monax]|uniref:sulfotransferase 2A1 n=1 Tax=Marmota monax TaxID=9995 RepID=UPI0026F05ACD|nr:sulfotransferase 2A1 [Marmota monax]